MGTPAKLCHLICPIYHLTRVIKKNTQRKRAEKREKSQQCYSSLNEISHLKPTENRIAIPKYFAK